MGNQTYLIFTYFLTALISLCLGLAAYACLRRPVGQIADEQPGKGWGSIPKTSFAISTIVLALSAFMSVSYSDGCPSHSYERIITDRACLLARNQQQISATLSALVLGVVLWALIICFCLLAIQASRVETRSAGKNEGDVVNRASQGVPLPFLPPRIGGRRKVAATGAVGRLATPLARVQAVKARG